MLCNKPRLRNQFLLQKPELVAFLLEEFTSDLKSLAGHDV